jgi:hypothetical protein
LDKHLHAQKRILHDRLLIAFTVNIYIYISDFLLIPMSHCWIYIYTHLPPHTWFTSAAPKRGLDSRGLLMIDLYFYRYFL